MSDDLSIFRKFLERLKRLNLEQVKDSSVSILLHYLPKISMEEARLLSKYRTRDNLFISIHYPEIQDWFKQNLSEPAKTVVPEETKLISENGLSLEPHQKDVTLKQKPMSANLPQITCTQIPKIPVSVENPKQEKTIRKDQQANSKMNTRKSEKDPAKKLSISTVPAKKPLLFSNASTKTGSHPPSNAAHTTSKVNTRPATAPAKRSAAAPKTRPVVSAPKVSAKTAAPKVAEKPKSVGPRPSSSRSFILSSRVTKKPSLPAANGSSASANASNSAGAPSTNASNASHAPRARITVPSRYIAARAKSAAPRSTGTKTQTLRFSIESKKVIEPTQSRKTHERT